MPATLQAASVSMMASKGRPARNRAYWPLVFLSSLLPCCLTLPTAPQAASVSMMASKDARVSLMGELLRHLAIVKAMGWEEVLADKVSSGCD